MRKLDGTSWNPRPDSVSAGDGTKGLKKNDVSGGKGSPTRSSWRKVKSAVLGAVSRPWWILFSLFAGSVIWTYSSFIWSPVTKAAQWTGPLFPLFVLEAVAFVGVEVASAKQLQLPSIGSVSVSQMTRETFAGVMTMSGSLGTLFAFVQRPDSPFADALHSTTVGLSMAVMVLLYTLFRHFRDEN